MSAKRKCSGKSLSLAIKVLFLQIIAAEWIGGKDENTAWQNITNWENGARLRLSDF